MSNSTFAKILTQSGITLLIAGRSAPFTMARDHKLFDKLLEAVKAKDLKEIEAIIDVAHVVKGYSKGKVTIEDGVVIYNGEAIGGVLTDRILELFQMGQDFEYMAKFLENLMQNPSFQSRQELYLFLENGNMPITEDGRFMAYKWVRDDYHDCHTGRFDNSVGKVLKMDRGSVDDRRENTCSYGFHVCTHGYEKFGTRLMLVAINPRDVVSVPVDYANAKMRVCEYEVIKEIPVEEYRDFKGTGTYDVRDSRGRFTKSA